MHRLAARRPVRWSILLPLSCLAASGCGGGHNGFSTPDGTGGQDVAPGPDAGADTGDPTDARSYVRDAAPRDVQDPPDNTIVYAHSPDTLYAIDPSTLSLRVVGTFDWPSPLSPDDGMADLAVDATGALVGVTFSELWSVDPNTAHVQHIANLGNFRVFNALTFVPAGVLEPDREVLVGGTSDGDYFRIDPATGQATQLGTLVGGWGFAGDIVSVAGAATYVTIHDVTNTAGDDPSRLATLDLATGRVTPIGSTTNVARVYGLGYWRSTLYGFSEAGDFITLDANTGATLATSRPVPVFWGAGSTTIAPIVPP